MKSIFKRGKIMKKLIMILSIYLSFNFHASAQVYPADIIVPPIPDYETYSSDEGATIFWLRCGNDTLDINFMAFWYYPPETYYYYYRFYIDWSVLVRYDQNKDTFYDPTLLGKDNNFKWNQVDGLIHDASTVTIKEEQIILENSYLHNEVDPDNYEDEFLIETLLTPNNRYIAGITHYKSVVSFHYNSENHTLRLWDSKTGKELSELKQRLGVGYHELFFSPQGNYLLCRYFSDHYPYDFLDTGEGKAIIGPQTYLIDLSFPQKLTSKRDVAFTSDDEYFVTERDGVPTLVHARTDTNILRYAMESPMISAAFSTDNQRLYIAGANSKIYVFDSHLPSHAAGWEVYP